MNLVCCMFIVELIARICSFLTSLVILLTFILLYVFDHLQYSIQSILHFYLENITSIFFAHNFVELIDYFCTHSFISKMNFNLFNIYEI